MFSRYADWSGEKLSNLTGWGQTGVREGRERDERLAKARENSKKYAEEYGPIQELQTQAAIQRQTYRAAVSQEDMMQMWQGYFDPAKVKAEKGYSYAAAASLAGARERAYGTDFGITSAQMSTEESRRSLDEAERRSNMMRPAPGVSDEEKIGALKDVLAWRERVTQSIEEERKVTLENSQAIIAAEKAEQDAIKEKLETRKAGLLGVFGETPEQRAKTTFAVQQARAHGIESLSPEMQGLAMQASAANPEWQQRFQAQAENAAAPEFERRWGMKPGEALAQETYRGAGGAQRTVNVQTIHRLEIDLHADQTAITQAVTIVMNKLRRELQREAENAVGDKQQMIRAEQRVHAEAVAKGG